MFKKKCHLFVSYSGFLILIVTQVNDKQHIAKKGQPSKSDELERLLNELTCVWIQADAEKHHRDKRGQSHSLSKAGETLTPHTSLFPPSLTDSERVNFSSALQDINAELVWSELNNIY